MTDKERSDKEISERAEKVIKKMLNTPPPKKKKVEKTKEKPAK